MFLILLKFQLQNVLNMFLLQKFSFSSFKYANALYKMEWFVEEIIYVNTSLMAYKVVFADNTVDFISI